MESINPLLFIILPISLAAVFNYIWSINFVIFSIPFHSGVVFSAIGHNFTVIEVAILSLGLNMIWRHIYDNQPIKFSANKSVALLLLFMMFGIVSVLIQFGTNNAVLVNPYGVNPDLLALIEHRPRRSHLTQTFLRVFSVGSIIMMSYAICRSSIHRTIRIFIFGALINTTVGILYQMSQLLDAPSFTNFLNWIGFGFNPRFVGSELGIPRMYSFAGEPGYTALHILFAFSVVLGLFLSTKEDIVFTHRNLGRISVFLFVGLLLTTSTTAYGGLFILSVVYSFFSLLTNNQRFKQILPSVLPFFVFAILILLALGGDTLISFIGYQAQKLQFSAGSGSIRLEHIKHSIDIVAQRPLFGVGMGGHYGLSLFGTIMAETGLVGLSLFIGSIILAFKPLIYWSVNDPTKGSLAFSILIGGSTTIITALVAKSITAFNFGWVWLAVALPIAFHITNYPELRSNQ